MASYTVTPTGGQGPVIDLTGTYTVTAAQSGTTFLLNSTTEFATTLPAVERGLTYTFIVKSAPSGADYTIVTASGANVIQGLVIGGGTGADIPAADEDTISFKDGQGAVGDWVMLVCDGTNWYVRGQVQSDTGLTFTAS